MTKTMFKHDMPSRVDEKVARDAEQARLEREWDREIDRRDHKDCRACHRRSDPDVIGLTTRGHRAHIVYASAGGSMDPSNRVTLCYLCHNAEHKDRLRFTESGGPYVGIDANAPMSFWRKDSDGVWFLDKREIEVGRWERD